MDVGLTSGTSHLLRKLTFTLEVPPGMPFSKEEFIASLAENFDDLMSNYIRTGKLTVDKDGKYIIVGQ